MGEDLPIRIVIADDHQIVLDGFSEILGSVEKFKVVAKALDGSELIGILEAQRADVVLLDINMPRLNGIEATQIIKQKFPGLSIIVLSMLGDAAHIKQMVDLGVDGYLLKNTDKLTLIRAIESVYEGKSFFDGEVTRHIINKFKQTISVEEDEIMLSERELEIITLIAKGLATSEIAERLFLSPHTVKTHRKNINFKLDIHSPAELIAFAREKGLIG